MERDYNLKAPKKIQVQPTNSCNLKCKFCWINNADDRENSQELSASKWIDISDQIKKVSPERLVVVGGGEPLMRRDVFETFLESQVTEDIYCSLVTNGTLLDRNLIKKMIEENWNHILFSIHSPDAFLSDSLRQRKGSFKKNIENISLLNKLKDKLESKEPTTAMTTVINEYNWKKLPEIVEFASSMGLEPLNLRLLQNPSNNCSFLREEEIPELIRILREIIETDFPVNLKFDIDELKNYHKAEDNKKQSYACKVYCYYPFFELAIFADGTVGPCCFLDDKSSKLTESVREKSLSEIWSGKKLEYLRVSNILNNPPKICKECEISLDEKKKFENSFNEAYDTLNHQSKKALRKDMKKVENVLDLK